MVWDLDPAAKRERTLAAVRTSGIYRFCCVSFSGDIENFKNCELSPDELTDVD